MNRKIILLFCFVCPLFCLAQNLTRIYDYDAAGNRTFCKTIFVSQSPPAPIDSMEMASNDLQVTSNDLQVTSNEVTSDRVKSDEEFFIEKIARVEIKIYPNPTTEKVTLEIANMEQLQRGVFKLFSMNGQLLQDHPVYSATTAISLANLSKGAYILKVQINDHTEDWKIIKN